jgi:hypothetical protein
VLKLMFEGEKISARKMIFGFIEEPNARITI